jgi:hypothetical protein
MARALACLLALLLLAGCASRPDHGASASRTVGGASYVSLLPDGRTVIFRGYVTYGTTKELLRLVKENPQVMEVHLTSDGGYVQPALIVANALQLRGVTTFVPKECASACTLLFLGGAARYVAPGAKLGFHRAWRDRDKPDDPATNPTNEQIRQRLLERGVSAAFAGRVVTTPADRLWYPSPEEMLAAGVITSVLSQDALPR